MPGLTNIFSIPVFNAYKWKRGLTKRETLQKESTLRLCDSTGERFYTPLGAGLGWAKLQRTQGSSCWGVCVAWRFVEEGNAIEFNHQLMLSIICCFKTHNCLLTRNSYVPEFWKHRVKRNQIGFCVWQLVGWQLVRYRLRTVHFFPFVFCKKSVRSIT